MKIIAICGSPRDKNTAYMIRSILEDSGTDSEIINLRDLHINACIACKACGGGLASCVQQDDMQPIYDKLVTADCILLGSPTYFDNVTGLMKNFMDRCLPLYLSDALQDKKAILVTVGNYRNGEIKRRRKPESIHLSEENKSVKACLKALEIFCTHLGIEIIGSVSATNSNPAAKQKEMRVLSKKIESLCKDKDSF